MTIAHLPQGYLVLGAEDVDPLKHFSRRCDAALRRIDRASSPKHWSDVGYMRKFSEKLLQIACVHGRLPLMRPAITLAIPYHACQVGCRTQDFSRCTVTARLALHGSTRLVCDQVSDLPLSLPVLACRC